MVGIKVPLNITLKRPAFPVNLGISCVNIRIGSPYSEILTAIILQSSSKANLAVHRKIRCMESDYFNPPTAISTRRFKARPVSLELLAIGLASPYQKVITLA